MEESTQYPQEIKSLPIMPHLDEICAALKGSPSHFLILTAETAAGKSTAVPLALLNHFKNKIVMLEPRRLAALAVSSRVAELLGERTGETSGYVMHLESRVSGKTRFTVMTEAVLTRMLQSDPSLEGIDVVVIDEFHERSIHADLALAFLREAMQLRNDLFVVVMSATIDTEQLSEYLGNKNNPAPVFTVSGRQYPVSVEYAGNISPSAAVMKELATDEKGSILVFLPGISDIKKTASELYEKKVDAEIVLLHSSVSFEEQKKVLEVPADTEKRRVILSSSIAETSLTVPGVTVVIDSGFSRINRMNIAAGMETLVTERESVFSAQQRKGRAGRTAAGRCVCLWNENDYRTLKMPPEILRTDLTPVVLECAQWGVYSPERLSWLDCPSDASWNASQKLLQQLGCLTQSKTENQLPQITELGKNVLCLGLHPRLACVALAGQEYNAVDISINCALLYSNYADASPQIQRKFCIETQQRIQKFAHYMPDTEHKAISAEQIKSVCLLAGFPDRFARIFNSSGTYQFPSGRIASLPKNDRQSAGVFPEWIVAPEADAGEREGRIYKYESIDSDFAERWLAERTEKRTETVFANGTHKLQKTEYVCYGKIIISAKKIPADKNDFTDAVCDAVEKSGIKWLPDSERIKEFLIRTEFYENRSSKKVEHTQSELAGSVREWLPAFLTSNSVTEDEVYDALRYYLNGSEIDKSVPSRITMPNGKSYKLLYEKNNGAVQPVLEIIIQQIFGCFETPRIMGVPVLLKLLSPARRPLQITDDIAGFWKNTWPEVCKEMKGRYPKHNWNYKIAEKD